MLSEKRICAECGKEFQAKSGNSKCCSQECSYERFRRLRKECYQRKCDKSKELTNAEKIDIISRKAMECGMSYGKYVAQTEYPVKINRKREAK